MSSKGLLAALLAILLTSLIAWLFWFAGVAGQPPATTGEIERMAAIRVVRRAELEPAVEARLRRVRIVLLPPAAIRQRCAIYDDRAVACYVPAPARIYVPIPASGRHSMVSPGVIWSEVVLHELAHAAGFSHGPVLDLFVSLAKMEL